ncbi:MAG: helix-turn-helix domain-containing protein [Parcubacteria group bacterium]
MRKIRSEKRVGLPEIAKNTKIQMEYLEYLENGDYNKLPADVYVRGFLKSFADYLGVNEEYLIKSFNKEKSIQENIRGNNREEKVTKKINISRFSITPKIISIFFISLFFLALSFYLYKNLNNFVSNPQLIILNPTADSVINDTKVTVKGKTDAGNNLFINNQPVLVDDNGDFSENVVLREGKNVIAIRSVNQFNKEATESISVEAHYNIEAPKIEEPQSPPEEQKTDNVDTTGVIVEPTPASSAVLGVDTATTTDVKKKKKK